MAKTPAAVSPLMTAVSNYIAGALKKRLPEEVEEKGKHHVLDTLAAMVSGSRLPAGAKAIRYVKALGGTREATVVGTRIVTAAANAALANGIFGHADETDDSHHPSNMHPGCAMVPASLAMAEKEGRDGKSMLRAVVLAYDIGCRITKSLRPPAFRAAGHSNHSFGGLFGAAAAAGALARLEPARVRYLLSYTSQQASGIRTFERDSEHMLKAFVFGGMTARNGVATASMVACGFTGVEDEFTGERNRNFFSAYAPDPSPEEMLRGLGSTYEIMSTNIKKWSVGSPMQAALVSLFTLMEKHNITAADVEKLVIRTPEDERRIVDDSKIPDINMQHLVSIALLDGELTFASAHDVGRMKDRKVVALKKKIELIGSEELTAARPPRQCTIEISTRDGRALKHHTVFVKGTVANPMTRTELGEKAVDLMGPILGKRRASALIDAIWQIEKIDNVRALRPLVSA